MKIAFFSICSAAIVLGGIATAGAAKGPNPLIRLTTDFPAEVTFNVMPGPGPDKLGAKDVKFNITLKNEMRQDETLTASTPCDVRSWRILDASGKEVQKMQKGDVCIEPVLTIVVPAGKSITGPTEVTILGKVGLEEGGVYTFEYTYFGYTSENKFTAHFAH